MLHKDFEDQHSNGGKAKKRGDLSIQNSQTKRVELVLKNPLNVFNPIESRPEDKIALIYRRKTENVA